MDERQYDVTTGEAADRIAQVVDRVLEAAVVEEQVLESMLSAILARGHVLLEDVPGTGKTVTARVMAEALGLEFNRIQFTPDLLPSDVTGSTVYDEQAAEFSFVEGPVFANVVLADEINRAPPKTQAALLEAMEERQVSADGETYPLPEPFVVIATQNPIEQEGTFRLPEAQRDRFSVKTSLGYPAVDGEMELLEKRANRRSLAPTVDPVSGPEAVLDLQELAEDVTVDDEVRRYIIELARATRDDPRTAVGVSPRGVQRVFEAARARAVIRGRDYVTPEDVKQLAGPTMAHRLVLTTEASVENVDPHDVVYDAMERLQVPAVAPGDPGQVQPADPQGTSGQPGQPTQSGQPDRSGQQGQSGQHGQSAQPGQSSRPDQSGHHDQSGHPNQQRRDGRRPPEQGEQGNAPTDSHQGGQPPRENAGQGGRQRGGQGGQPQPSNDGHPPSGQGSRSAEGGGSRPGPRAGRQRADPPPQGNDPQGQDEARGPERERPSEQRHPRPSGDDEDEAEESEREE